MPCVPAGEEDRGGNTTCTSRSGAVGSGHGWCAKRGDGGDRGVTPAHTSPKVTEGMWGSPELLQGREMETGGEQRQPGLMPPPAPPQLSEESSHSIHFSTRQQYVSERSPDAERERLRLADASMAHQLCPAELAPPARRSANPTACRSLCRATVPPGCAARLPRQHEGHAHGDKVPSSCNSNLQH